MPHASRVHAGFSRQVYRSEPRQHQIRNGFLICATDPFGPGHIVFLNVNHEPLAAAFVLGRRTTEVPPEVKSGHGDKGDRLDKPQCRWSEGELEGSFWRTLPGIDTLNGAAPHSINARTASRGAVQLFQLTKILRGIIASFAKLFDGFAVVLIDVLEDAATVFRIGADLAEAFL